MTEGAPARVAFVETVEHRRFVEFCDACRHYRYIGLCYGSPGVGKTLSARRYADWDALVSVGVHQMTDAQVRALGVPASLFYTPGVVNTPRSVGEDLGHGRRLLHQIARESVHRTYREAISALYEDYQRQCDTWFYRVRREGSSQLVPPEKPNDTTLIRECSEAEAAIPEPTRLILIDEADRLKMASLEAVRDLFARGDWGLILIGMPGIEKRMARYPQFYSRIGFVHEFRPLGVAEIRRLLAGGWRPSGITLGPDDEDSLARVARVARVTGGNFRLLHRLLAQAERIARLNGLGAITGPVVDAARESLVIGSSLT